jgi:hypothetical protein
MTNLLEVAVEELRALLEDEQDRAAHALIASAREPHEYSFDADQVAGIYLAMRQADRGEFASDASVRDIFGRIL